MPLLVIVNGNIYLNKPDLPILGEALREMVGELKRPPNSSWPLKQIKYPLRRDQLGRFIKP